MKVLVKITEEIIQKSLFCGTSLCADPSRGCAIALAIREILPNARVGSDGIFADGGAFGPIVGLPLKAIRFIHVFDSLRSTPHLRLDMELIEFDINIPDKIISEIGISEVYKILSESKTLQHTDKFISC